MLRLVASPRLVLVLDTETTGLPFFPKGRAGHFYPPHFFAAYAPSRVIEIAWQLFTPDGMPHAPAVNTLVNPGSDACMDLEAEGIHGITLQNVRTAGTKIERMLDALESMLCSVDGAVDMVGHNVAFDWHVLMSESLRAGKQKLSMWLRFVRLRCTMYEGTAHCRLPRPHGAEGYKWPTLGELQTGLFGADADSKPRHRALQDVRVTARCFFELQRRRDAADEG